MPCFNAMEGMTWDSDAHRQIDSLKYQLAMTQAMLCGLLRGMKDAGMFNAIEAHYDAKASGVSLEEMLQWFEAHKVADARRGQ